MAEWWRLPWGCAGVDVQVLASEPGSVVEKSLTRVAGLERTGTERGEWKWVRTDKTRRASTGPPRPRDFFFGGASEASSSSDSRKSQRDQLQSARLRTSYNLSPFATDHHLFLNILLSVPVATLLIRITRWYVLISAGLLVLC